MVRLLFWALKCFFFAGAFLLAAAAVAAFLGFVHPFLDCFNHLQPLLFLGTLFCMLSAGFFFVSPRMRALTMAVSATGFLASAVIVVPEAIAYWTENNEQASPGTTYRLYSQNIFGLNYDMPTVLASIERENPDIIALQEYFPDQRALLHRRLLEAYPYFKICVGGRRANIAIYAKTPFTTQLSGACMEGDQGRTSRIVAQFTGTSGKTFQVATTHLDWPIQVSKILTANGWAAGLTAAIARQRDEFLDLEHSMKALNGPVILVGDFNSTAWSYMLRTFAAETGLTRNSRNLLTFPATLFFDKWRPTPPILPLDQVFSGGGLSVSSVRTGAASGSDHLPLITEFTIK